MLHNGCKKWYVCTVHVLRIVQYRFLVLFSCSDFSDRDCSSTLVMQTQYTYLKRLDGHSEHSQKKTGLRNSLFYAIDHVMEIYVTSRHCISCIMKLPSNTFNVTR